MRLFGGDPKYPRRNIGIASLLLGVTSFRLGSIFEHLSAGMTTKDYIRLTIWLALTVLAIIDLRLGIRALPPDPKESALRR